jgi:hypothetical protein
MAGKNDIYRQEIARMAAVHLRMLEDLTDRFKMRRRKPPGTAAAPIPADPNKPDTLSGGAAAPLEFD